MLSFVGARWHGECHAGGVNIAIPVLNGRISPVLDSATRLLLVTHRQGKEVARQEITLSELPTNALAQTLVALRVEQLFCAALSAGLLRALQRDGIQVRSHLCGPVEAILQAFACRRLDRDEFRMPGCRGHHRHQVLQRESGSTRTPRAREKLVRNAP
jgi:predicted Fe-Mo cluster-binding NifX family protein